MVVVVGSYWCGLLCRNNKKTKNMSVDVVRFVGLSFVLLCVCPVLVYVFDVYAWGLS